MTKQFTVAAVQFEMTENNKATNLPTMKRFVMEAKKRKVDVVLFPELCSTGYHF